MSNNITPNLLKWINELTALRNSILPAAVASVLPKIKPRLHQILWQEIQNAIRLNSEFDYPLFVNGLQRAAFHPDAIFVDARGTGERFTIVVAVQMEAVAGSLMDYKKAVETVRQERKRETSVSQILATSDRDLSQQGYRIKQYYKTPKGQENIRKRASEYWKNFIYGQAREGVAVKIERKPGQKGRTPTRISEGREMYKGTMQDRFALLEKPAPFWKILDMGAPAAAAVMDAGGFPHPVAKPTHFVRNAERKIREAVEREVLPEMQILFQRLEQENYGAGNLLEQIQRVFEQYGEGSVNYVPGAILRELKIREREYNLYITKTNRIGLRLS